MMTGSRPYMTGDDIRAIDWARRPASPLRARATRFIVPRAVRGGVAQRSCSSASRRPGMVGFAPPLPWLDKAAAMRRAQVGHSEHARRRRLRRLPRLRRGRGLLGAATRRSAAVGAVGARLPSTTFSAPPDSLGARACVPPPSRQRAISAGSFLFVFSDFLPTASASMWQTAPIAVGTSSRWLIQDPIWGAKLSRRAKRESCCRCAIRAPPGRTALGPG